MVVEFKGILCLFEEGNMPVGLPEFVQNPENRCPVILLLDTSGSRGQAV
jgi:hypothetical protein